MAKSGWFADLEDDEYWYPSFQLGNVGCVPMDIGFQTKESCEEFIREEILGAGLYDDS